MNCTSRRNVVVENSCRALSMLMADFSSVKPSNESLRSVLNTCGCIAVKGASDGGATSGVE